MTTAEAASYNSSLFNKSLYTGECADVDVPKAQYLFQGEHLLSSLIFLAIALVFVIITVLIFVDELTFIVRTFEINRRKVLTIWVLAIYPVFSVCASLGLFVPRAGTIVDLVSNVYFSTCLYQFVRLMISYMGGKEMMWEKLSESKVNLRGPPCCCCCFCCPEVQFSKYVRLFKGLVWQITIVRPGLQFIAAVLWANGSYIPGLVGTWVYTLPMSVLSYNILQLEQTTMVAMLSAIQLLPSGTKFHFFFRRTEWLAFQVTLVRPFLHFIAAVMWANGSYVPGLLTLDNGYTYIAILNLTSTFTAVYGLLLLQKTFKPVLESYQLGGKFLSIQSVLLLTVIPNIIINILVTNGVIPCSDTLPSKTRGERIYHGFVVILMLPLSLIGRRFYRRKNEGSYDVNMNGKKTAFGPQESMKPLVEMADKEMNTSRLSVV